ncbi:hypothetical protein MAR_003646 [Mya arenaria]|uniref:Secreted protein n=1 Tax=Mya arenaria TaxID=6604 RepID=A0ABY7G6N2_MYAAR|nr:hypothetical protein MAR_003646 [Mya arenaria]
MISLTVFVFILIINVLFGSLGGGGGIVMEAPTMAQVAAMEAPTTAQEVVTEAPVTEVAVVVEWWTNTENNPLHSEDLIEKRHTFQT